MDSAPDTAPSHPAPAKDSGSASRSSPWWTRPLGLLSGSYAPTLLGPERVREAFEFQFKRDALGHRIHTIIAITTMIGICGPTVVAEFALIPLTVYSAIRVLNVWRCWVIAALSPVGLLLIAFALWAWLSLLWTEDLKQGVDEALNTRWVLLPGMLWPILDQRRKLILALIVGMLCANVAQVVHAIGVRFDIPEIRFPRAPDRNSAWWYPVVAGCMLTAALGLHLPAAFMGHGRTRLLAAAGSLVTLVAILATGTRGAMLASIGLLGVTALFAVARAARRGGISRTRAAAPLIVGTLGVALAGVMTGPGLARRFDAAWNDLDRAIEQKDFNTDTGARLLMAWKAIEATASHPLRGVGIGGYNRWCREDLTRQGIDPASRSIHAHAHNAYVHIPAALGLPGLGVACLTLAAALMAARMAGVDPDGRTRCIDPGTYDAGPLFALIGLALVAMFDPLVTNMPTTALLCALMGLCVMPRPSQERGPNARQRETFGSV